MLNFSVGPFKIYVAIGYCLFSQILGSYSSIIFSMEVVQKFENLSSCIATV